MNSPTTLITKKQPSAPVTDPRKRLLYVGASNGGKSAKKSKKKKMKKRKQPNLSPYATAPNPLIMTEIYH